MKSAAQTKNQSSKNTVEASRDATPARRTKKETMPAQTPAAPPARAAGNAGSPMPDLTTFGVDQRDAQAHVGQCEQCGRASRHVVKNPKDAMALQSFGRNIAVCLAGKPV